MVIEQETEDEADEAMDEDEDMERRKAKMVRTQIGLHWKKAVQSMMRVITKRLKIAPPLMISGKSYRCFQRQCRI